ncbi:sensor histidine kinase [Desulfurivibrio alkaliphilus]|uniref:histidine kinase n=1 Tax=Desulfurivibrio alkaliphilus (strain DSM 19089 / UNIQEM U267 / AHT2) TaxID=589865 RepID=D6Z392_DESAT|nr:ATP-binding protein [Desulfurivibrio alkaliphilus]ADH86017.1 integral membrane sensor signal transduction histidine kinase [Desulfurivibrio alkaliphilus AHT 2]
MIGKLQLSLSCKLIVGCVLTLLITMSITFYLISLRQERLIVQQAENEARTIFRQIIVTRKWVADHGGIFVRQTSQQPWIRPSPFMVNADITDQLGRRYLLQTPAMVTKALADYAKEEETYWFRITSLNPVNPANRPDETERAALEAFSREEIDELMVMETISSDVYLRYISPLYIDRVCLDCHGNYRLNEVRGAISVAVPLSETFAEAARNRRLLFASMGLVVMVLSGSLLLMIRHLVLTPMQTLATAMTRYSRSGHADDAVVLQTGDELEALSHSFASMAGKLSDYHHNLEDKIQIATRDLEQSNRQLLEANRLLAATNLRKSDFIARASHELRTPLTSVKGGMEYLTAKLASLDRDTGQACNRDELLDFLKLIRNNTDRLIRMVNTMLDIEHIEMGTVSSLNIRDFDLALIIWESREELALTAAGKDIELTIQGPQTMMVRADEDRIRQVLTNLLANAVKFSPTNSAVQLCFRQDQEVTLVEVLDRGAGIEPGQEEKIFEKFYRLGDKEGSGLGLAICRSIIEAHGGHIGAENRPGGGARFYFQLPSR